MLRIRCFVNSYQKWEQNRIGKSISRWKVSEYATDHIGSKYKWTSHFPLERPSFPWPLYSVVRSVLKEHTLEYGQRSLDELYPDYGLLCIRRSSSCGVFSTVKKP